MAPRTPIARASSATKPRNGGPLEREYDSNEHAGAYLGSAEDVPHRSIAESMLIERLPRRQLRVLDLGCGDGRLLARLLVARPGSTALAVDISPPMLRQARARFRATPEVRVLEHDLTQPLPARWSNFGAVVSSFAIHHLEHARKQQLYAEVFAALVPGGVFCNLEHVASPTAALHQRFIDALQMSEDATNVLLDVETQLRWLRDLGFEDVDCDWKWLELALLAGVKPAG